MTLVTCQADLAQPDHARAVLSLMEIYARDPMGGGEGLSEQARAQLIPSLHRWPTSRVVLGFVGDEPVALAIGFLGFSTFACQPLLNVHDVVIHPAYRGQGLTRPLFEALEAVAREAGCCKITLEVLEGNKPARRAYESLGFRGYQLDPALGQALFWEKKLS